MPLPGRCSTACASARAGAAGQRLRYARYKTRQFDRLAEAMREHIAIDRLTPSCANIRSLYADSGYRRRAAAKSRHAEALIAYAPQVLYIATSQILDDEMAAGSASSRRQAAHWRTAERWQQLDELITRLSPQRRRFCWNASPPWSPTCCSRSAATSAPRRLGLRRHGTGY